MKQIRWLVALWMIGSIAPMIFLGGKTTEAVNLPAYAGDYVAHNAPSITARDAAIYGNTGFALASNPRAFHLYFTGGTTIPQGAAPFVVEAEGRIAANSTYYPPSCDLMQIDWGDGTTETYPCNQPDKVYPAAKHTYERPGLYYIRTQGTFGTGNLINPEEIPYPQAVVVEAGAQPLSLGQSVKLLLWLGSLGLAIAAWVALEKWMERWPWKRRLTRGALIMALLAWVPPFSYAPTPLAFFAGGYDPRLPFVNRFLVAVDPTEQLSLRLNGLIGLTGLDPFDPAHALVGYEFKWVAIRGWESTVTTEMIYADGSRRTYDIPIQSNYGTFGVYLSFGHRYNWNELNRLYAEHMELPDTPFPTEDARIKLGTPEKVELGEEAEALLREEDRTSWYSLYSTHERSRTWLAPSPDGKEVLIRQFSGQESEKDLWKLDLVSKNAPLRLTDQVLDFAWSPDGKHVIYNTEIGITNAMKADGTKERAGSSFAPELRGFNSKGLWEGDFSKVTHYPFSFGDEVEAGTFLPTRANNVFPNPQGTRILYPCELFALCYQEEHDAQSWHTDASQSSAATDGRQARVAWTPNGKKAAVTNTPAQGQYGFRVEPVELLVLGQQGATIHRLTIAPNGVAGTPQWTPDGRFVLVQTQPYGGRRIVAVDTETGKAWDLSRPHWDAWFAMMPDGKSVLMANGRGGLWRADLIYKE